MRLRRWSVDTILWRSVASRMGFRQSAKCSGSGGGVMVTWLSSRLERTRSATRWCDRSSVPVSKLAAEGSHRTPSRPYSPPPNVTGPLGQYRLMVLCSLPSHTTTSRWPGRPGYLRPRNRPVCEGSLGAVVAPCHDHDKGSGGPNAPSAPSLWRSALGKLASICARSWLAITSRNRYHMNSLPAGSLFLTPFTGIVTS